MTDLHCHILPKIDDGAKSPEISLELLRREQEDGVNQIALTSHFICDKISLSEYLQRRQYSFELLKQAVATTNMQFHFKLGAEVYFSPELADLDLHELCLEGTDYLLIEFSTRHRPYFLTETLQSIQAQGIIPLIAHVERYPYIMDDLTSLYDLVDMGVYIQSNAGALIQNPKRILKLIRWNLVHVLSTDSHSIDKRPPNLAEGIQIVRDALGDEIAESLIRNGNDIFSGHEPEYTEPHCPKKLFNHWF